MENKKICRVCKLEKIKDQFTISELKKNRSSCKCCDAEQSKKEYIKKHPESIHTYNERENIKKMLLLCSEGEKYCKYCNRIKNINFFTESQLKQTNPKCKLCKSEYQKTHNIVYYANNKEKISKKNALHRLNNPEMYQGYKDNNKKNKKEYNLNYYLKNKDAVIAQHNEYEAARKKIDPVFKARRYISAAIYKFLKSENSSKNGKSISEFIPFEIEEYVKHIEGQFEWWMTWENQGKYTNNWNDGDFNTWKWQVDHIIPQSDLPYDSMEHYNFKKAWDLKNLRPLSAKQNQQDGVNRTRHIKKDKK